MNVRISNSLDRMPPWPCNPEDYAQRRLFCAETADGREVEACSVSEQPKGARVNTKPALRVDDEVLTEAHAILSLVGDMSGDELLPGEGLKRARAHEWMNFLSATVHVAFRPLFRPNLLIGDESLYPRLRETGVPILRKALLEVDRRLADRTWALGEKFSVVDPYLLVFWIWSQRDDVVPQVADMPNWRAHAGRVFARPATWHCLNREGVTRDNIADP